jgi:penicillin-binding protein 1C
MNREDNKKRMRRTIPRTLLAFALLSVLGISVTCIFAMAVPYDASTLSPDSGGPLLVTDRHGRLLRSVPSEDGRPGRDKWVGLEGVSSYLVLSLLASEDSRFFEHHGVDPIGILRALWLNLKAHGLGYGGSTLSMQLVRMIHHPKEPRTIANKIKEALLAIRLERAVSKTAILEQYLNRAYYGHGSYGIESAARRYFDKPALALSPGEATFLSVLPRGPAYYDPLKHPERVLARRTHILRLLHGKGLISANELTRIEAENILPQKSPRSFEAPHFVNEVMAALPQTVRQKGGIVRTTLDLELQRQLERRVAQHVETLAHRGLGQAGLVLLDTRSGEVLAMVGSPDFQEDSGQLNITTTRRHPGSALKPFVYALALEKGDTPASIAYDIANLEDSTYRVKVVTQPERGPVRYREALAGSYNLAAIHVLEKVGIHDLISKLRRAGVGQVSGTDRDYGLRLALGATKVKLVDLASAYGFLGRAGRVVPSSAVLETITHEGRITRVSKPVERSVFSPQVSFLVMDMLADAQARQKVFGQQLPLDDLPFPVALKTGTSRGFADTVAVGVTAELTAAAWSGNFDGRPTHGLVAMNAAAPLVRAALLAGSRGRPLHLPSKPPGIEEARICPVSGLIASSSCPHAKVEFFESSTLPSNLCDWHKREPDGRIALRYPAKAAKWARSTPYPPQTAQHHRPPL